MIELNGSESMIFVCRCCNKEKTLPVDSERYQKWRDGKDYIQNLFPELSAEDRELMLSGTCGPCFDKMFPAEEE